MSAACVDLKELFGDRYRITVDEAWEHRNDPWTYQIPCQRGGATIYPHGGARLALEIDGRPKTAKRILEIPGVEVWQRGGNSNPDSLDGECTLLFDVSLFEQIAAILRKANIGPRLKRHGRELTPEERDRLLEAGERGRKAREARRAGTS